MPQTVHPATSHGNPSKAATHHTFGATDALLLLTATIWGINFSAVKYGSLTLSPITFTWLRIAIAMTTLVIVAVLQRRTWPNSRDMLGLIGLGILGNGIYQLLFVNGVARTRVADAALLVASCPAFIAVISQLRGVERVRWRAVAGIALSIAGVGIVVLGSANVPQREGSLFGAAIVCLAVVCWAIFTVGLHPYTLRVDPIQLNALTMIGGMLPLLVVTPMALQGIAWNAMPTLVWPVVFYSSVISIGIAYLFWYRGVRVLGPTRTAVYANLQPIVAILFAWLTLGEAPTLWQGIGTITIMGGIVLTRV